MRFLNTSKRKDALKCQKINSNAGLQLLCNGARQMKDLKGKLIWICKGDFKEPNASCQAPRCHASCRHSRLPNVSNTCPGGCSLAAFLPWWFSKLGYSHSLLLLHFLGVSQQSKSPFQRITTITHSLSSCCSSPRLARDSQVKTAVNKSSCFIYQKEHCTFTTFRCSFCHQ